MASAIAEEKKTATKFLVWYGTLPAPEAVPTKVPTRDKDSITQDYFRVEKQEPADLWNGVNDARVWVGKCRFFQSIGVRGFVFPAFSEAIDRSATNENTQVGMPYPGAVQVMKKGEIDKVIRSCNRHAVRFGAGNGDIYSLKNQGRTKIIDLDFVTKPASWTEAQWVAERQRIPMEGNVFDADTDMLVSEFVYMVPIEIENFDALHTANGIIDVRACVSKLPHQNLDRGFFTNPPKSVAEAFPQGK